MPERRRPRTRPPEKFPVPTDAPSADLLAAAAAGDAAAADALHGRLAGRAERLAKARLPRRLAGRVDPADVTQSAWNSLFLGANAGRLVPRAPGDAWRLLAKIVVRKAGRLARRHGAARRDAGRERGPRGFDPAATGATASAELAGREELGRALADLPAASRPAARLVAEGWDADAAAARTGRSPRTVRRDAAKLRAAARGRFETFSLPPTERYGDYLLTRFLGAGGTGKVYRATHRPTGERVAVKYLRKGLSGDVAAVRRFRRGCAAAAALADAGEAGVVRVRGVGRTPGRGWFAVLDLAAGPDLQTVVDAGPVAGATAARWAAALGEVLARCHAAGVTHGDVKPANVLLSDANLTAAAPLLTDFAPPPVGDAAATAAAFGSPAYCAPEQADPVRRGVPGAAADVWGLGATLFALLTGRPPRVGESAAVLAGRAARGEPVPAVRSVRPQVPADVAALCDAALAVRAADRPAAAELAAALRRLSPPPA